MVRAVITTGAASANFPLIIGFAFTVYNCNLELIFLPYMIRSVSKNYL